MNENVAKDIEKGFKAFGDGIKEAGKNKNNEDVAKQGYVGFRKLEAIRAFQSQHPDWICKVVNGEHRFYPPLKEDECTNIINNFRSTCKNFYGTVMASITILDDLSSCRYSLRTVDKQTGKVDVIQESTVTFEGNFSMVVLPSIFYTLCNNFPAMKDDKGSFIRFTNIDLSRVLLFSHLTPEHAQLINDMERFIYDKMGLDISNNEGRRF